MTFYRTIQPSGALFSKLAANAPKQPRDYANISNDSLKSFDDHQSLNALATELGIDFSQTGYTFCARRGSGDREFSVYGPAISASRDGAPVIVWGYVAKRLDDLAVDATLEIVDDKYPAIFLHVEGVPIRVSIKQVYVGQGNDRKPALNLIKLAAAFNAGDVSEGVETLKVMSQPMGKLPPNTEWRVRAYAVNVFGKDALLIEAASEANAKFNGWYTAEDKVSPELSRREHLIETEEVTLSIGPSRGTTKKGNNLATASLTFASELDDEGEEEAVEFEYV